MTSSTGSGRSSDDDLFVLVMVGFLALGGVVASAGVWWAEAVRWLLAHRVLVTAATTRCCGCREAAEPGWTCRGLRSRLPRCCC